MKKIKPGKILWNGDFFRMNSFAIVNRNLIANIEEQGYEVIVSPTDQYAKLELDSRPDIYVFHNYPYDIIQAPGKINIFYIPYEYFEFTQRDYFLPDGINTMFDMVVVPSRFTKNTCINSGVRIPVEVIPEGYDPEIYNPNVAPFKLATNKNFKFINLGGAFDRKGHDILIQAYVDEFNASDDVTLILKAFSYQQYFDWIEEIVHEATQRPNAPEIYFEHEDMEDIAGYYTAADCGVYPYRGEGFGLTILETIACGRPVIVTKGGSTDDFCTQDNAIFLKAQKKEAKGKKFLEPDYDHLRTLMRQAFARGKGSDQEIQSIQESVSAFTWKESAKKWSALFDECMKQADGAKKISRSNKRERNSQIAAIFYDYEESISPWTEFHSKDSRFGAVSPWKYSAFKLFQFLNKNFDNPEFIYFSERTSEEPVDLIIGEAGFSYEHFNRAKDVNPNAKTVLFHDRFPVELGKKIEIEERNKVGIQLHDFPIYYPLLEWRYDQEIQIADHIIFLDSVSSDYFENSKNTVKAHNITPPVNSRIFNPLQKQEKLIFFFWGYNSFRKGIRILFEAWNNLKLKDAELICVLENKLPLSSTSLIKHLVRNPSIKIYSEISMIEAFSLLEKSHVQLIPALGDGFFMPVAQGMSMGKPTLVTTQSGLKDIIIDDETGKIIEANELKSLENGILYFYDLGFKQLTEMGEAAYLRVQRYNPNTFANQIVNLTSRILNGS